MARAIPGRLVAALAAVGTLAAVGAFAGGGKPAGAQQVVLPLTQFSELREKARLLPESSPPPPAPFALAVDDLEIIAGPDGARIVQTLSVRLLSADWVAVPIGDPGSFIGADLGGLEGRVDRADSDRRVDRADTDKRVERADSRQYGSVLQVRGQGEHRVRLESVVPVTADAAATRPTWHFSLRLPAAAVAQGTLALSPALSGTVEEVAIDGGGLLEDGRHGAPWRFAAAPAQELAVRLLGRAVLPERARLPLRFDTTVATAAVLSHTRLRIHGWVVARVAQGRLAELRLRLPPGATVEEVAGASVAGWKVESGSLVVTPREAVEETLAVAVNLSAPPQDAFTAPLLRPQGALRTTWLVRAALQGDGLLELADPGSTRSPDAAETAQTAADPAPGGGKLYLVDDPERPPRWQAAWAERTAVLAAQIDDLWVEVAAGNAGAAAYQVWAEVRNRGTAQLAIGLPAGFELEQASRDGVPLAPGLTPDRQLAVPLLSRDAAQRLHLAGLLPLPLPRQSGRLEVPLPVLSAPAARIHVRLLLPGDRSYALADPTRAASDGAMAPVAALAAATTAASPAGAGELAARMLPGPAAAAGLDRAGGTGLPAGCVEVAAEWAALSAAPAPLALKVETRKEKEPWF
jgi:hypothetical protein